ncbi:MAG: efflux RND transporter periplasmic adaptor subunit [Candidatus Sericytochromatia bacterium]|nr:efflux RND transporter periplasmic adaptor subunit [Candidatus Sericytochromatia bacterium]
MTPLLRNVLVAGLLAGLGLGAGQAWQRWQPTPEAPPPEAVVRVTRGPLAIVVKETGRIQPFAKVDLRSKVAGQVLKLHVRTGDQVRAGQVLLELDATDLRRQAALAEADVAIARAQLSGLGSDARQAELVEARAQLREARKRPEPAEAEAARRRLEVLQARLSGEEAQARAQLRKAELSLSAAREQLGRAVLRSPVSGTVVHRAIEVGEMVTPGVAETADRRSLLTIANLSRLLVAAEVNQIDVARLRVGMPASVRVDALPGQRFEGRIHQIAPAAVPGRERDVQLFPVEVLLEGRQTAGLRPGMNADVDIAVLSRPGVLQLPIQAVRRDGDGDDAGSVAVVERVGGQIRTLRRAVRLGVHNDQVVELRAGMAEGEEVLVDPPPADGNVNRF